MSQAPSDDEDNDPRRELLRDALDAGIPKGEALAMIAVHTSLRDFRERIQSLVEDLVEDATAEPLPPDEQP
ncbi:hypothetical protein ACFVH7_11890 [Kitasatospora indigofera]|uniref:hypothetical protein n=1 Tax=Kitasatospora indigofera TaxID=67307 RepID=UPI00363F6AD9